MDVLPAFRWIMLQRLLRCFQHVQAISLKTLMSWLLPYGRLQPCEDGECPKENACDEVQNSLRQV